MTMLTATVSGAVPQFQQSAGFFGPGISNPHEGNRAGIPYREEASDWASRSAAHRANRSSFIAPPVEPRPPDV